MPVTRAKKPPRVVWILALHGWPYLVADTRSMARAERRRDPTTTIHRYRLDEPKPKKKGARK